MTQPVAPAKPPVGLLHIQGNTDEPYSLLERLEQVGITLPYQCRSGYCGMCRVRLHKGTPEYFREPMAWLNEGEILPCCCRATDDMQIDITS